MIPIIDLFAGPGGLGEGFSSLLKDDGSPIFQIIMSVEMEKQAHNTLRLRSYYRKLIQETGHAPKSYISFLRNPSMQAFEKLVSINPDAWKNAQEEALCAELKEGDYSLVEEAERRLLALDPSKIKPWILIGGPPCQAYSLVGRSRRTHDKEKLENDKKQTLYKCYLAFIERLKPTVFVMENVKGLLSAKNRGAGVFNRIVEDMHAAGYDVKSLVVNNPQGPYDYVVKSELYGIPQARHRVILLGIQHNSGLMIDTLQTQNEVTLGMALAGIPRIRSGFSERNPGWRDMNWKLYLDGAIDSLLKTPEGLTLKEELTRVIESNPPDSTTKNSITKTVCVYSNWYRKRIESSTVLPNHESRTHLAKDLDRYLFCAAFADHYGVPAKIYDFPSYLLPEHKNVAGAKQGKEVVFPDRFRVQLPDRCSTTITSHIHKDGHYYIHPDASQCRSLTVREAARLQTFPDDYFFMGTRTSQYTQVGNAVPPLLARQIAETIAVAFSEMPLTRIFDEIV